MAVRLGGETFSAFNENCDSPLGEEAAGVERLLVIERR
jgi:hypothetical protein